MKIGIASDLHLEFGNCQIVYDEKPDVLVLAGDIVTAYSLHKYAATGPYGSYMEAETNRERAQLYRQFIFNISREFENVVVVAGNHEFYGGKWEQTLHTLRLEYGQYDNIHFLERDCVTINGVTFVGGTLWTDMNNFCPLTLHDTKLFMNDFSQIVDETRGYSKLKPATTVQRHIQTKQYITYVARETSGPVVVVGHHAPSFLSIAPQYKAQTLTNGAYASELSEEILNHPNIKLWCHGHMHDNFDYYIGDTRIVCNPRGYVGYESRAKTQFALKIVEI